MFFQERDLNLERDGVQGMADIAQLTTMYVRSFPIGSYADTAGCCSVAGHEATWYISNAEIDQRMAI